MKSGGGTREAPARARANQRGAGERAVAKRAAAETTAGDGEPGTSVDGRATAARVRSGAPSAGASETLATAARPRAGAAVTRTVLREQVKELLLQRILAGAYRPGDRLVETRIAQELGTSQAPVREALRDLELLRFVESEPFRGARVRAVSTAELAEIYPVRAALEEVAARAAAVRLEGRTTGLVAELSAMRDAADDGDLHAFVEHDVRFHRLIVEASGNRILLDVWASLGLESRTAITAITAGIDHHELADKHEPIVAALAAGDPDEAAAAVRRHIEEFGELVLEGGLV